MIRRVLSSAALVVALSWAGLAQAGVLSGSASGQIRITDSGGIQILSRLSLPSVAVTSLPSNILGNSQLIIRADTQDTLSMAVPSYLTLVRTGGSDALTMDTMTYGLTGQGVLLGGGLVNGAAMSIDIGANLSLASAPHPVPGPYTGLFVIVVQYN